MSTCATCGPPACADCQDPYGNYSLVGQSWLNNVEGFGPDCPPGFICGPTGPGPGEPPWDPPPVPDDPGGGSPTTLQLEGCESTIIRTVPAGTTAADYQAILQQMLAERHEQQVRCDGPPNPGGGGTPPPVLYRSAPYCLDCPNGNPMIALDALPSGLEIDNGQLCSPAGAISDTTSQADVDFLAAQFVNNSFATLESDGVVSCEGLWIFDRASYHNLAPCPDDPPTFIPGVASSGTTITFDIDIFNLCTTGFSVGFPYWTIFSIVYYNDFGPFGVDKNISVIGAFIGTITHVAGRAAFSQVSVLVYLGLSSTPIGTGATYLASAGNPAPTNYNDPFSISGVLPAGETLRVVTTLYPNGYFRMGSFHHTDGTVSIT